MASLEFIVPGKGRPKGRAKRTSKHGFAFIPRETRNAEALVKMAAAQARGDRPLLRGALKLTMIASFPIPSTWPKWMQGLARDGKLEPTVTPDLDNVVKLVSDGLNGIAYADDKAITREYLEKRYTSGDHTETWVLLEELYSAELIERLEGRRKVAA